MPTTPQPYSNHLIQHYATLKALPDRDEFFEDLSLACKNARHSRQNFALLIIDIFEFRHLNTIYGYKLCDSLLLEIANRLRTILRDNDRLYRIGGDEFAIITGNLKFEEQIELATQAIIRAFSKPFTILKKDARINLHIGIAEAPKQSGSPHTLMQYAEGALLYAKRNHLVSFLYDARNIHDRDERELIADLERAFKDGEIELHFQPKLQISSNEIVSAEALTRWTHPMHGPVSPEKFIPLIEQSDLLIPFTQWTINSILHLLEKIASRGKHFNFAVNLSPIALSDPEICEIIERSLRTWNPPPGSLTLEVTEGAIMNNPELCIGALEQLSQAGIKISIDDFGTGHSSLAYLKQLPANELKIDKSFVLELSRSKGDFNIVKSVIDLGHNFGMDVVAEGIEESSTLDMLKMLGCDQVQGYFISPPLCLEDFIEWMGCDEKIATS